MLWFLGWLVLFFGSISATSMYFMLRAFMDDMHARPDVELRKGAGWTVSIAIFFLIPPIGLVVFASRAIGALSWFVLLAYAPTIVLNAVMIFATISELRRRDRGAPSQIAEASEQTL
jgi:hypothetical protein